MNVISCSCGNDSVALIQHAKNIDLDNVVVVYINTGWASEDWPARVEKVKKWVLSIGFKFEEITSMGMLELVRFKKAFPANQYQFCTQHLKGIPFLNWIEKYDPDMEATVLIGKRRVESKARENTPEYILASEYHGGRTVWHPLYLHPDIDRDALLKEAGFEVLNHRSKECHPCVNANKADFNSLTISEIQKVSDIEVELGKPMFRPKRFHALGIYGVVTWAKYGKKKMQLSDDEVETGTGCDGQYGCGL